MSARRRYHPLVLETADAMWTDDEGQEHPMCTCCYACSGLTDDSELWTCSDGLGCCDRRVVEQRVCDCPCHLAYVVSVHFGGSPSEGGFDIVVDAKDERDGLLRPGCDYLTALALVQDAVRRGLRVGPTPWWWSSGIEWDSHRDPQMHSGSDGELHPCCRCHLGYERADRIISAEWETKFGTNNDQGSKA